MEKKIVEFEVLLKQYVESVAKRNQARYGDFSVFREAASKTNSLFCSLQGKLTECIDEIIDEGNLSRPPAYDLYGWYGKVDINGKERP